MKMLTLTQPWASLVAIGVKKNETRSWNTKYRGPLGIHAAKGFPEESKLICRDQRFSIELFLGGYDGIQDLPLGIILATCELVETVQITEGMKLPESPELDFGDYRIGRYIWKLENVKRLSKPILAKGALGLWEYDL